MPEAIADKIKILLLQADCGFADHLEIPGSTTVEQLFHIRLPNNPRPESYTIRVNREPVARSYVLQNGDRVSISPAQVKGAIA